MHSLAQGSVYVLAPTPAGPSRQSLHFLYFSLCPWLLALCMKNSGYLIYFGGDKQSGLFMPTPLFYSFKNPGGLCIPQNQD